MLCQRGRFGQKTGRGWYRYEANSRNPLPDPEVAAMIEKTASRLGIARRQISDLEIIDRTLTPMIREGEKILAEGVAARASDIDLVWVHGYGFPKAKGGPMFYSEQIKSGAALAAIQREGAPLSSFHLVERQSVRKSPALR
jgi:3-hydroxyacyl-CoA dehydrogenase